MEEKAESVTKTLPVRLNIKNRIVNERSNYEFRPHFSFPLKNRSVLDNKDTQTKLGGNI